MQQSNHQRSSTWRTRRILTVGLSALVVGVALSPIQAATADDSECGFESETLVEADIPAGTSVIECDLVGETVFSEDGQGIVIPEPGTAVIFHNTLADGEPDNFQEFQLEVSTDGVLSFPDESVDSDPTEQSFAAAAASPSACSDKAYSTNDVKEYGTYNWYLGDGGMPAGLSQSAARVAFGDAVNNITGSTNNCSYADQVSATSSYKGTTTVEADINSSGTCTARDQVSTWDAGNLQTGVVASTCTWTVPSPGIKNDLVEADVRYNTTDYSFTNAPTSGCSSLFDVRSVGTHEAGHVFGMGHVGAGHTELTMYTTSFRCQTKARSLGAGDVLGLRSIY